MEEFTTNIQLIDNNEIVIIPTKIMYREKQEDIECVEIRLIYHNEEYIGKGKDYTFEDAFADLQFKLPTNVKIACCIACKHGNFCPYGNFPREMYCLKNYKYNSKKELEYLFEKSINDKDKVLCDSYCGNFENQTDAFYTYNDYLYYLKRKTIKYRYVL